MRPRFAVILTPVMSLFATAVHAQSHTGFVVDGATSTPLANAVVVVNASVRGRTDGTGYFAIDAPSVTGLQSVLATHPGQLSAYLNVPASAPTIGLALTLPSYPMLTPGFEPEGPRSCTTCHASYGTGWEGEGAFVGSAHSTSALNPRVLDIWRGTASGRTSAESCAEVGGEFVAVTNADGAPVSRCYVGAGLLPDLNPQCGHAGQPRCDDHDAPESARPTAWSDCAGCHTPGAAIRVPSELDLDVAEALPIVGSVTCAGCHRIADVGDPDAPGVLEGATMIRGSLPSGLPLGLGPLDDSGGPLMATGHAPLFSESRLCAPCHQDTFHAAGMNPRWAPAGVPSEQTYAEWFESPYASGARESTCQNCHMPSLENLGVLPTFAEIATDGPSRSGAVIHTHDFSALTGTDSLEAALDLAVETRREGDLLIVDASITNVAVGHGFPSGVTSRNALIVVTAELTSGPLVEVGGEVLPLYAGSYDMGRIVSSSGGHLTLDHALDASAVGRELRAWTDSPARHAHESFGVLRALPPSERAMMLTEARGRFRILAVRGVEVDVETLGASLGDLSSAHFAVGDEERLAGVAGLGLAKVNRAADGSENVPFWRAVDVLWDNRLAPDETQRSEHRFAIPRSAAGVVTVRARLLYRRAFADLAAERGWAGNEDVALDAVSTLLLETLDAGAPDANTPDASTPDAAPSPDASLAQPSSPGCGCALHAQGRLPAWLGILGLALGLARRARRSINAGMRR